MTINSSSNYWISPTALTITLNANGDKDYIQANVAGGAMIMCYMPGIDGLGFDNGHNYQRWQLVANPTYFNSETEKFVYVAIPRTRKADNDVALVVFPSEKIDVYGKNAAEEQLGSADYYYIYLQGIISASVVNGEEHERVWTAHIETGTLSSDEALTAGGDNTWWRLNIVDQTVSFLKEVLSATIRDLTSTFVRVTNLVFPSGTITGVANNDTPHDSQMDIVTPEFLFGNTDARFVRRDIDDKLNNFLTFLQGIHFGEDFQQSLSGAGIYKDDKGQWHIEGDIFHARRKFTAEEVEVMNTSHIKGKVVNSAGGFVISRIEKVSGAWRCYFRQQDAEGRRVYNSMRVDDLALCETFNLVDNNGQAANHYWHRRVTSVGTDYVDVADNTQADDYASGSDEPQVGDEVVQLGNPNDKERQSAIIQSAAGTGSPYFKILRGINSFTLPQPIFLFDSERFEIRIENPQRKGEYVRLQDFLESMQGRINAVQQQADKQLVIWFGDAVPTLTNEPANEWADDTTKELHLHDIYYNRSYAQTGGGRAYSFEKNPDNTYSWHEITDADVLKSLEAAKQAQDTADGKRRVFVKVQPTPPYDKGDQWANATYDTEYQNDLLVCVKPKKKGEAFDIADWQSAQAYTTKKFEAQLKVGDKTIDAAIRDLRTGLESVGIHLDGENSTLTMVADKTKIQGTEGTPSAIFNADGTIDARHIIAQGTEDRIEYGIIDGRANLIIKDKQGNTMLLLNRNGIVLPTDITAYARRKAFTMTVKDASDGVYVSVLISLTLFVRNTGFERNTFGNNIRIEVDVPILGIKDLVVPVGVAESDGQGKTLNVDETGEILYVTTWDKQYKVGTPIPLTPEFEYRVLWRNKVIDKGSGEITRIHEGS
nr:MAG TPA: Putative tail protein [Caudoviricetes sp.]